MPEAETLYDSVVEITTIYLGPTADRFITRQIRNHLQKDPEALVPADLRELVNWMQIGMAFLTNDQHLIHDFTQQILALSKLSMDKR